ncbi:MAG: flagellar biosynthetic protein FliO [Actinomycetota bacterium]|nr:flagellar biosynthetic protein FliO [Actinomycetota bacterium]
MPPFHRLHAALAAAALACLLAPAAALAQRGERTPLNLPADDPGKLEAAGGGGGSIVRTVVGLAVVLAVIYGLHWVLKQVKAGREERAVGRGLAPHASVALGPNRSLHLVRAGTELVLVGVAEGGVTPIRTYSEDEARAVGLLGDEEDLDVAPQPAPRAAARDLVATLRSRTVRS